MDDERKFIIDDALDYKNDKTIKGHNGFIRESFLLTNSACHKPSMDK